mgnify:CR=1 FL=1
MWYGQKNTDKLIALYYEKGYVGNCIEVGVADGKKGSNTLHFEELGWDTLCIDPIPAHVEAAKKIRKNVLMCACGEESLKGEDFYVFDIGDRSILSSLSGLKPDPKLLVSHGHLINKCHTIGVSVERLDDLIKEHHKHDHIDFISIDTEGTEVDVLKGLDLTETNYTIGLLVVENNHNELEIEEYLREFNWVKRDRYFVNDFYVKVVN